MAAANDDDDAWLYGENADGKRPENAVTENSDDLQPSEETEFVLKDPVDGGDVPKEVTNTNGENVENGEDIADEEGRIADIVDGLEDGNIQASNENDEGGSDDDDSDDDVQVTIGDIKSAPSFGYGSTPVNLNIKRSGGFVGASVGAVSSKPKGIDLETIGTINGIAVYEFNLDSLEDKPWRKPGADITDYFNYGFNEEAWKIYCDRQRKHRTDNDVRVVKVHHGGVGKDQLLIPIATVNENSKYATATVVVGGIPLKKAGPPPGRKMSGSIDVIGGGTPSLPSRRPPGNAKENVIQVLAGRKPFELPPGMPPPPPHLAPTHLPPPNFITTNADGTISIPPPGTLPPPGIPPPNLPPPLPGNPFGDHFPPRFPPPSSTGNNQFDEHSGFYNGGQGPHGPYEGQSESTQQSWGSSPRNRDREREGGRSRDREHDRYGSWEEGREHYRERSSRRTTGAEEEYERRRHRDYSGRSRERERERDPERGSRDPERGSSYDKEYEREDSRYERDRDREKRHREHRERDDRHRERSSRRRHHHENEEEHSNSRSSRHKHKRSKKDKDEESASGDVPESASEPVEEVPVHVPIKEEKIDD